MGSALNAWAEPPAAGVRGPSARPADRLQRATGHTILEILFAAGLVAVIAGISIPQVAIGIERGRTRAAARYLAAQLGAARARAVSRSAFVALRFQTNGTGVALSVFVDGNGNGVRVRDIESNTDTPLQAPVRLDDLFPGVVVGVPSDSGDAAVALGGTELLSFSPSGTATSGTIHVLGRDGTRFAVRVLGVTGRVRVQRLDASSGLWIDSL
jgi:Tfp pilus assembly protein FimT